MIEFAKIFNSEKMGQLLVKLDSCEDSNPEVRFYFNPPHMGVCSQAYGFNDDVEGWERAETLFNDVDLDMVEKVLSESWKMACEIKTESKEQH